MRRIVLVPVLGFLGLGTVSVAYALVGVALAVLMLALLTVPLAVAFKRFAPHRYARLQSSRPIW